MSQEILIEKLRTVFEMHGVVVVPLSAPDKAMCLKNLDDLQGDLIAIGDRLAVRKVIPAPVVGVPGIDIDSDAEAVHAGAIGPGNDAPAEGAGRIVQILMEMGTLVQFIGDCLKFLCGAVGSVKNDFLV